MTSKIKCAEYRYITKWIWDLSEEEEKKHDDLTPEQNYSTRLIEARYENGVTEMHPAGKPER